MSSTKQQEARWKADSPLFSGATMSIDLRLAPRKAGYLGTFSTILPNGLGYSDALARHEARAEQIVRAVNSHDELLEALELAESEIAFLLNANGREGGRVLERVRAAISKAKGESQ